MVRFKHRYLVATVAASPGQTADLGVKDIMAMLKDSIATTFGDMGAGLTAPDLQVRSFDAQSGVCIVRAGRDSHRMVNAALTLLSGKDGASLSVTVEAVAGCDRTLKAAAMAAYARGYHRAGLDAEAAAALLQQRARSLDAQER